MSGSIDLSDDATLSAYVETELEAALDGLPAFWKKGRGLTLERGTKGDGRWAWTRRDQPRLAWEISTASQDLVLYYDLLPSRDLEGFLLTHSNVQAGLPTAHWLVRNGRFIPFAVCTNKHKWFDLSGALTLRQIVVDTIWKCQPNFDWPT